MNLNEGPLIHEGTESVALKAVGDIAPGDFLAGGLGIRSISKKYGCDFLFHKVRDKLADSDLLLGNLEGTLSRQCLTRDLRLCGLPEVSDALRRAGFDVLSVANNHSFDYGPEIFKETLSHCEQAGIQICGLRGKSEYYSEPVMIRRRSLTMGILAYNWIGLESAEKMGEYIATVEDSVVNYTWNRNREKDREARAQIQEKNKNVMNDIRRLREKVDVLILMPHWGYEWTIYPPYGVTLEARSFIDAGVDLILGCHSHVAQGMEKYKDRFIAYSLGNFLFDGIADQCKYGAIFECRVGSGRISEDNLVFIKRGGHFLPEPVSEKEMEENRRLINKSSEAIASSKAEEHLDDERLYQEYEREYNKLKREKVAFLFKNLFIHPFLIGPIFRKALNLLSVIALRMKGRKVRW